MGVLEIFRFVSEYIGRILLYRRVCRWNLEIGSAEHLKTINVNDR
jgi:hypothetical protein